METTYSIPIYDNECGPKMLVCIECGNILYEPRHTPQHILSDMPKLSIEKLRNKFFRDSFGVYHRDEKCRDITNEIISKYTTSDFNDNWDGHDFSFHKLDGEPDNIPYYGVELELSYNDDDNYSHYYRNYYTSYKILQHLDYRTRRDLEYRTDGTVHKGIEIVTHIFSMRYHKEIFQWEKLMELLRSLGYTKHETAGVHIHSSNLFGRGLWKTYFYCLFIAFNRKLSEHIANRESGQYRYYPSTEHSDGTPCQLTQSECNGGYVRIKNQGEIETRIFASTTDTEQMYSYLEYVDSIGMFIRHCVKTNNELITKHMRDISCKINDNIGLCGGGKCGNSFIYNKHDNEQIIEMYIDFVRKHEADYGSLLKVINVFLDKINKEKEEAVVCA